MPENLKEEDFFDHPDDRQYIDHWKDKDIHRIPLSIYFKGNQSRDFYIGFLAACRVFTSEFLSEAKRQEVVQCILESAVCAKIIAANK